MAIRTAVLISGNGSNLQALLDGTRRPGSAADIVLVVSSRPDVAGLERAERAGVSRVVLAPARYPGRTAYDQALDEVLRRAEVELVCLAGFMRLLGAPFVAAWCNRLLNIHPSLLPAYRGLHPHERALADGVKVSGCTVHFVRPEMDAGPIIVQGVVPVLPDDTPSVLSARVLGLEHRCYPKALELVASGRARVLDERVVADAPPGELLLLHPSLTGASNAAG